ncbi:lytic transglycosylase domain-containing protein [Noviherbaspirillum aridicola]|nr:lytic transglycosylase domain-containing protein [Noviherbaspirillum aridicola]
MDAVLSRPVRRLAIAALLPALLAACAVTPPPRVEDDRTASVVKPARVLPRHILSEWGTFGADTGPGARSRGMARLPVHPAPVISPTIREIMASATCRDCEQKPFHEIVMRASSTHGVPPALIHAVIEKESGYNPRATSPRQARGLMQVTPATGRMVGVDSSAALYDPHVNIHAGTAYLRMLMESHDSMDEVLAAYNAGPGNVRRYNGVPPFSETRRYVHAVKRSFVSSSSE